MMKQQVDIFGEAMKAYHSGKRAARLHVESDTVEDEDWPLSEFFHSYADMSQIERRALSLCSGRVLDVGAGSGSHSLWLQEHGIDVCALDVSVGATEVMKGRGLTHVVCQDFMTFETTERFDTILMLMNGLGIACRLEGLAPLLRKALSLLSEGGQIVADSCDLRYLYQTDDGGYEIPLGPRYYGEIDYHISFDALPPQDFNWLFVGYDVLHDTADAVGLSCRLVVEDNYNYLAVLNRK